MKLKILFSLKKDFVITPCDKIANNVAFTFLCHNCYKRTKS